MNFSDIPAFVPLSIVLVFLVVFLLVYILFQRSHPRITDERYVELKKILSELHEVVESLRAAAKILTGIVDSQGDRIRSVSTKVDLVEEASNIEHVKQDALADHTVVRVDKLEEVVHKELKKDG